MLGRESAGVPEAVHEAADARLVIPMVAGLRSLNVATAAAMVLGEALRQTGGFPDRDVSRRRDRTRRGRGYTSRQQQTPGRIQWPR